MKEERFRFKKKIILDLLRLLLLYQEVSSGGKVFVKRVCQVVLPEMVRMIGNSIGLNGESVSQEGVTLYWS